MNIIDRPFYQRNTPIVAQDLLGKTVVRIINGIILMGIIVETEAYSFKNDPASHAYRGKTKRNVSMFGMVGYTYIYFIYGNHFCLNIVAKSTTITAGAVLIRALEPVQGTLLMLEYRNNKSFNQLTNGPGKLTQALQISTAQNGIDITQKGELFIIDTAICLSSNIVSTRRIGLSSPDDKQWRFYIAENKWVSHKVA